MWNIVQKLQDNGVTIILTTHYLEEAEAIADRVSIINNGQIILTDNKADLLKKMGQKVLDIQLQDPITDIPNSLSRFNLTIGEDKQTLCYIYDTEAQSTGITNLLQAVKDSGLKLKDLQSTKTSLEKIFLKLVEESQ